MGIWLLRVAVQKHNSHKLTRVESTCLTSLDLEDDRGRYPIEIVLFLDRWRKPRLYSNNYPIIWFGNSLSLFHTAGGGNSTRFNCSYYEIQLQISVSVCDYLTTFSTYRFSREELRSLVTALCVYDRLTPLDIINFHLA